jgi:hypothetical protein
MVVAAAIVEAIIYAQGMNLVGMVRCSIQACKPLTFGATGSQLRYDENGMP